MEYSTDSDMDSDSIADNPQESCTSTSRTQKPKKWAYTNKYQTAWESNSKFSSWISISKKGDSYFYCKSCRCECKGDVSAVYKHNTSKKHIELSSSAKVDSVFNMLSMINQKAVIKNIK